MVMAITDKLIERVKSHEGYRISPYKDTVGKWTVGYGRNLEDNPLTAPEVIKLFNKTEFKSTLDAEMFFEDLLIRDIELHTQELEENLAMFPMCDKDEQTVLIDMAFNLGVPTLLQFEGMLHAIDNDDRVQAAVELLDSQYAEQVKTRAGDNARLLSGSRMDEVKEKLKEQDYGRYTRVEPYL